MVELVYFTVLLIGILHGLEPGHGWPIAMLYASTRPHPLTRAFVSSSIISIAHLVSSIAVVAAYVILRAFLEFSVPYINIIAGIALTILAIRFFIEKPKGELEENHGHLHDDFEGGKHIHEHSHHDIGIHTHKHKHAKKLFLSLTGIAVFALILGFAHEEEFALLALAVAGIDPLTLMLTYAAAVMMALISVTLMAVKVYSKIEEKVKKYEGLIPKISGMILLVTAVSFFLNLR
ncbi:MAG: nickel/cobalt transporter [archaeon]|nr:nickel/cobalt transporter [archaeon]